MKTKYSRLLCMASVLLWFGPMAFAATEQWSVNLKSTRVCESLTDGKGGIALITLPVGGSYLPRFQVMWINAKGEILYEKIYSVANEMYMPGILAVTKNSLVYFFYYDGKYSIVQVDDKGNTQTVSDPDYSIYGFKNQIESGGQLSDKRGFFAFKQPTTAVALLLSRYTYK